jgi:hypothetical protein
MTAISFTTPFCHCFGFQSSTTNKIPRRKQLGIKQVESILHNAASCGELTRTMIKGSGLIANSTNGENHASQQSKGNICARSQRGLRGSKLDKLI